MGTRFNRPLTRVACSQSATAATKVVAAAAADPATLALAQKLIAAVQASAGLTGWNVQTLAADPTVQVLAFALFQCLGACQMTSSCLLNACRG